MRASIRHPVALIAVMLATAGAGCSSDSSDSGGEGPAKPSMKETVTITAAGFHPRKVEVLVGGTVTWINKDPRYPHTAETTDPTYKDMPGGQDASFDTHTLSWGEPYTFTFHVPGTFEYGSSYDAWTGTVDVVERTPPR